MVYGVGAGGRLVAAAYLGAKNAGATAMENIDPRFPELDNGGSFSQKEFNLEEAATLNPNLIIAGARSTWLDTVSELGIPSFLYDAETPEALKEAILLTGQLFGPNTAAQAEAWVKYYDWITDSVIEQTQNIPDEDRIQVLFTGTDPLRIASGEMIQSSLIEIAGGVSVSSELTGYWNDVNLEQIAASGTRNVIIVPRLMVEPASKRSRKALNGKSWMRCRPV